MISNASCQSLPFGGLWPSAESSSSRTYVEPRRDRTERATGTPHSGLLATISRRRHTDDSLTGCGGNAASRGAGRSESAPPEHDPSNIPEVEDRPDVSPGEADPSMPGGAAGAGEPGSLPVCRVSMNPDGFFIVTTQAQVDDLSGCETINGALMVAPPDGVGLDLRPLSALRRVTGDVTLGCNSFASTDGCLGLGGRTLSLEGLEGLESVCVMTLGQLRMRSLASLRGSRNIGSSLTIAGCDELTSLAGLEGVSVSSLSLQYNAALASLSGPTITTRADSVHLQGLPALKDLALLAPLTSVALRARHRHDRHLR